MTLGGARDGADSRDDDAVELLPDAEGVDEALPRELLARAPARVAVVEVLRARGGGGRSVPTHSGRPARALTHIATGTSIVTFSSASMRAPPGVASSVKLCSS